jgi:DNA sulfur modification protein DndD
MIFEQMTLCDFRQFAGKQQIRFATGNQQNVTVIHGFNGAGKTAFLNAFTWVLYNDFSPDFEASDLLENEASFATLQPGERLRTSVEVVFRDSGRKYTAERFIEVEKDENGTRRVVTPTSVSLLFVDESGEQVEEKGPRNPDETLQRMLPKRLCPFFFFNGERIERLASPKAYQEIADGVRTLLDIELFDRAVTHLEGDVSRRLRNEIQGHTGDEGRQLLTQRLEIDEQLQTKIKESEQHSKNRAALETERESIDAKLHTMAGLAMLLTQRKEAEKREAEIKSSIRDRRQDIARELSRTGYLWLIPNVLDSAYDLLAAAREKGQLPSLYRLQFVEDILEKKSCICGAELVPGSQAYEQIEGLKSQTYTDALQDAVNKTSGGIGILKQQIEKSQVDIDRLQTQRDGARTKLTELEEELSELSNKIGDREHGEDPEKLENRRNKVLEQIVTLNEVRIPKTQMEAAELIEKIAQLDRDIRNVERADAQGQVAQRRLNAVHNVRRALAKIRQLRHTELRDDLSQKLEDVWGRIAIKDYAARLDNEFRLQLTKQIDGEEFPVRGASTGEKQVLSLAFVGALGAKARSTYERAQKSPTSIFKGGLYPLVIDSAFGNLEIEYRREVARWIPTLAPQVIIMVSESQWRQEVEEELLPRIGAEWVMRLETTKKRSRNITLRDTEYSYVVPSDDGNERTTFAEVEIG